MTNISTYAHRIPVIAVIALAAYSLTPGSAYHGELGEKTAQTRKDLHTPGPTLQTLPEQNYDSDAGSGIVLSTEEDEEQLQNIRVQTVPPSNFLSKQQKADPGRLEKSLAQSAVSTAGSTTHQRTQVARPADSKQKITVSKTLSGSGPESRRAQEEMGAVRIDTGRKNHGRHHMGSKPISKVKRISVTSSQEKQRMKVEKKRYERKKQISKLRRTEESKSRKSSGRTSKRVRFRGDLQEALDPKKIRREDLSRKPFSALGILRPKKGQKTVRYQYRTDIEAYEISKNVYEEAKSVATLFRPDVDVAEAKAESPRKVDNFTLWLHKVEKFFDRWRKPES